jgi:signal transduction histidine kinase
VLRHAQATRVDVTLEEEEAELVLKIRDNGRGITEGE